MGMSHIIIYGLTRSTLPFQRFLINGMIFEKKKFFEQKCVFSFSLQFLSETVLNLRRTERDMIIKAY